MADMGKIARDAGYILLGMTIIRLQRAQVRRRELEREIGSRLEPIAGHLPGSVRDLVRHGQG